MITGRELILYILENKLEDTPIVLDGGFLNLMTVEQAAVKAGTGVETVLAGITLGLFRGVKIGNQIYILPQRSNQ
jgi:hypothetical protein